jgi:hypothetical protein
MKKRIVAIGLAVLLLTMMVVLSAGADPPNAELIRIGNAHGFNSPARCNNGDYFSVPVLDQSSDNWVIYLAGGGYCDDDSWDCDDRAVDPDRWGFTYEHNLRDYFDAYDDHDPIPWTFSEGILATDSGENPDFYDANMMYIQYCSSDLYSGDGGTEVTSEGTFYFAGREIFAEALDIAVTFGLDDDDTNQKVVFAGSSAGAIGVLSNADQIAAELPDMADNGQIYLISDGGFINYYNDSSWRPGQWDRYDATPVPSNRALWKVIRDGYDFWDSELPSKCEDDIDPDGKCFLADRIYEYIVDAEPDGYGLKLMFQVAGEENFLMEFHGLPTPYPATPAAAMKQKTDDIFDVWDTPWLWSYGGAPYHTILLDWRWATIKDTGGKTVRDMVHDFFTDETPYWEVWGW